MPTKAIRILAVAMLAAVAMLGATLPAFADAEYPPDEPTESMTTMEESVGDATEEATDESAAADTDEVATTGAGVVAPLAIGLTAVAAGGALLVARRRAAD